MGIIINNNVEQFGKTELFTPDGVLIGEIKNHMALLDVLVRIKKKQQHGYYMIYYDNEYIAEQQRIRIDNCGDLDRYPNGFCDQYSDLLFKLM